MTSSLLGKDKRGFFFLSVVQGGDISTETFVDIICKQMSEIRMLNASQSRKRHERYGKEDLAGVRETRTIGSGLRGHSDDQIRPLKPDDRPEMTKENARQETEEEDALTENKGDWGSRKGWDVPGSVWELGERLTLE